jgi:hypothetical protein
MFTSKVLSDRWTELAKVLELAKEEQLLILKR